MTDEPNVTQTDLDIINAAVTGEGLVPLTPDLARDLAQVALTTKDLFAAEFENMTREQAAFVRRLRVEGNYTWRAVAHTCALEWGGDWGSNQLAGIAICQRAARFFSEHYMQPPWN